MILGFFPINLFYEVKINMCEAPAPSLVRFKVSKNLGEVKRNR